MSKANVDKIKRGESVTAVETTAAATFSGVSTTDQGRARDIHSIVADLGRLLKTTITLTQ